MKCPHCTIAFHDNWDFGLIFRARALAGWAYRTANCPSCRKLTLQVTTTKCTDIHQLQFDFDHTWVQIHPAGANRGPVPPEVPAHISQDYIEACNVLPISAKASAALSRRCLQNVLRENGYKGRDLAAEIEMLLDEKDPTKAIPSTLRVTVDGVRNFGNFSAHPITDISSRQLIDVEDHEAEWCLEILEEAFQHFYVRPAEALARKAALDAKLASAGKPPSR